MSGGGTLVVTRELLEGGAGGADEAQAAEAEAAQALVEVRSARGRGTRRGGEAHALHVHGAGGGGARCGAQRQATDATRPLFLYLDASTPAGHDRTTAPAG